MTNPCDEYEVMISGYLDGELAADDQRRFEAHLQGCPRCRTEYEHLKRLIVGTTRALEHSDPPEEVWDGFLDAVYNRLERKFGWLLFIIGAVLLTAFGILLFITEPWASALTKILITIPIAGLMVLFVSVLRQRLRIAKTDRYSREVHR